MSDEPSRADSHDPAVLVLQVVRSDIAGMRGEVRQDIKDLRAEMVTQAEHRASEQSHDREHAAMRQDITELRTDLSSPPKWPAIVGGIGSVVAMFVAGVALFQQ